MAQLASRVGAPAAADPVGAAAARIDADTTGQVTLSPDGSGGYDFLGVAAASAVDNPGVTPSTSVADAARRASPGTARRSAASNPGPP